MDSLSDLFQRLATFRETDNGVESFVAELRNFGTEQSVDMLRRVVKMQNVEIAAEALDILCRLDSAVACECLKESLYSLSPLLRWAACWHLSNDESVQCPGTQVELLLLLARETDGDVRCEAVQALTVFGTTLSLLALEDIIKHDESVDHESSPIRHAAKGAIDAIVAACSGPRIELTES